MQRISIFTFGLLTLLAIAQPLPQAQPAKVTAERLHSHAEVYPPFTWSPDSKMVVVSGKGFLLLDAETGKTRAQIVRPEIKEPISVALYFTPDSSESIVHADRVRVYSTKFEMQSTHIWEIKNH